MPHASAIAHANHCTPAVASVPQIDRRPWPVRIRDAAAAAKLPSATRGFAVMLATYFDSAGRWSVSIEALADATGLTARQVYVHLKRCKDADLFDVRGGGGRFRNRYSAGPAVCPMKAAEQLPETAFPPVQDSAPVRIRSGSQRTSSKLHSPSGTRTASKRRADPRDGDRVVCPKCKASWPRRFGTQCFTCSRLSPDVPGQRPVVTKRGNATDVRYTCPSCKRSWPQRYGKRCRPCGVDVDPSFKPLSPHQLAAVKQRQAASTGVKCGRCLGVYDGSVPGAGAFGKCPSCTNMSDAEAAKLHKAKGDKQRAEYWAARSAHKGEAIDGRQDDQRAVV